MVFYKSGRGYTGPREIKYLFIDGGCFRQLIEDTSQRYQSFSLSHIDWLKLVRGFTKIFYYDSLPPRKKKEDEDAFLERVESQETFFNALRSIPGVHVYEGDARRRRKIIQQKKVDIMIAVDMLTHSFRRNMHQASLLTADLDFKPLVDALVQDGMQVELWYPYGKPNKELVYAADRRRPLTYLDLYLWSTDSYQNSNPAPKAISSPGKNIQDGILREIWPTAMGTKAEVYENKSEQTYVVVFPSHVNQDKKYYTYVSHPNLEFLKIYVHECLREFWNSPI